MADEPRYLVIRTDDIEPFTHPGDPAYHSQHVLGEETTGRHDLLLNQGTVDPHQGLGGGNHPDNDEIYYVVSGRVAGGPRRRPERGHRLRDATGSCPARSCSSPTASSTACATTATSRW